MAGWASISAEIRLLIFSFLPQTGRGWAAYASVCAEWQVEIEKHNFRQLKLRTSRVNELEDMVRHRRPLVKHIWLGIELPFEKWRTDSVILSDEQSLALTAGIKKLFALLSEWDAGYELTLELSAYAPSDKNDFLTNLYLEDCDGRDIGNGSQIEYPQAYFSGPTSNYRFRGRHHYIHESRYTYRIDPYDQFLTNLPTVDAIKSFVLRRQCRRVLRPRTLARLLERLPRLEALVHEPWELFGGQQPAWWLDGGYNDYLSLLNVKLPKSVKTMSIFEDDADQYPFSSPSKLCSERQLPLNGPNPLCRAFAAWSCDLEHLSISFMIEAEDFFAACQPSWVWRLKSLTLTSRRLSAPSGPMQSAARAALFMPTLRSLVIWNADRGKACKFSYDAESASITWEASFNTITLEEQMIDDWKKVVEKHSNGQKDLQVREKSFSSSNIYSYGQALDLLRLPASVVDPASLWQMKRDSLLGRPSILDYI